MQMDQLVALYKRQGFLFAILLLLACTMLAVRADDKLTTQSPGVIEGLHRLAEQGHAEAQYGLGFSYLLGNGVSKDVTEPQSQDCVPS